MTLVYLYLFFSAIGWLAHISVLIYVDWLRKKGLYPKKGCENIENVEKLLKNKRFVLAIRCYRTINPDMSLKVARQNVLIIQSKLEKNQH